MILAAELVEIWHITNVLKMKAKGLRCQTVRPAKGVQSDSWKSCQISC